MEGTVAGEAEADSRWETDVTFISHLLYTRGCTHVHAHMQNKLCGVKLQLPFCFPGADSCIRPTFGEAGDLRVCSRDLWTLSGSP